MKRPQKAIVHAVAALAAISLVAACSADVSGSATTVVAVESTNFQTIPPVSPTTVPVTTTLPIGAVGVEQTYTVLPGDSPSLVATIFGITSLNCSCTTVWSLQGNSRLLGQSSRFRHQQWC